GRGPRQGWRHRRPRRLRRPARPRRRARRGRGGGLHRLRLTPLPPDAPAGPRPGRGVEEEAMSTTQQQQTSTDTQHVDLAITGMTCASCSARIERKLNKLDGVEASVNLATEK